MNYEINVSKDYKHLFATHKRSISDMEELKTILNIFKLKFPKIEGFNLSVTAYQETGEQLDIEKI